jgi:hypothetical protein
MNESSIEGQSQSAFYRSKRELLLDIARQYSSPSGGVEWKRAWRDHPEWVDALKVNLAEPTPPALFAAVGALRKEGILPARIINLKTARRTKANRQRNSALHAANGNVKPETQPLATPIKLSLEYCPACGVPIGALLRASYALNTIPKH